MKVLQEWKWQGSWDAYSTPSISGIITDDLDFMKKFLKKNQFDKEGIAQIIKPDKWNFVYSFNSISHEMEVAIFEIMEENPDHYYSLQGDHLADLHNYKTLVLPRSNISKSKHKHVILDQLEKYFFDQILREEIYPDVKDQTKFSTVVKTESFFPRFLSNYYPILSEFIITTERKHEFLPILLSAKSEYLLGRFKEQIIKLTENPQLLKYWLTKLKSKNADYKKLRNLINSRLRELNS